MVAVVVVVAAGVVGGRLWGAKASAAQTKSLCHANQRRIEAAAFEYEAANGPEALAKLDGPVNESCPLTIAVGSADPLLAPPLPDALTGRANTISSRMAERPARFTAPTSSGLGHHASHL